MILKNLKIFLVIFVTFKVYAASADLKKYPTEAFYHAIINDDTEVINYLVTNKFVDINYLGNSQIAPVYIATKMAKLRALEILLFLGADVNTCDKNIGPIKKCGSTLLHVAIELNRPDIVEILLQKDPNLTLTNGENETALEFAENRQNNIIADIIIRHKRKKANILYSFLDLAL